MIIYDKFKEFFIGKKLKGNIFIVAVMTRGGGGGGQWGPNLYTHLGFSKMICSQGKHRENDVKTPKTSKNCAL